MSKHDEEQDESLSNKIELSGLEVTSSMACCENIAEARLLGFIPLSKRKS